MDQLDHFDSFLAPRSTSTMVTQITAPAEEDASHARSAITHRVVGYACDGSSPTLGIHTNYTGGRTVAKDLIFEGLPLYSWSRRSVLRRRAC